MVALKDRNASSIGERRALDILRRYRHDTDKLRGLQAHYEAWSQYFRAVEIELAMYLEALGERGEFGNCLDILDDYESRIAELKCDGESELDRVVRG